MSTINRKITNPRIEEWHEEGVKYTVQQESQDIVMIGGLIIKFIDHWKVLKVEKTKLTRKC